MTKFYYLINVLNVSNEGEKFNDINHEIEFVNSERATTINIFNI